MDVEQKLIVVRGMILNGNNESLFVKRSSRSNYAPGCWEFPGGRVEKDEDEITALYREVFEETGLQFSSTGIFFQLFMENKQGPYAGTTFDVRFHRGNYIDEQLILSAEHDGYLWLLPNRVTGLRLSLETYLALEHLNLGNNS